MRSTVLSTILITVIFSPFASLSQIAYAQDAPQTVEDIERLNASPSPAGGGGTAGGSGSANKGPAEKQGDKPAQTIGCLKTAYGLPVGFNFEACFANIANIFMRISGVFLAISGMMMHESVKTLTAMQVMLEQVPVVDIGWTIFRDLANIMFIFILLWISIGTILGLGSIDTKHVLANVIVIGLLLNFSLFITKVVIDSANVVTIHFYDLITRGGTQSISAAFMDGLKIQTISKERGAFVNRLEESVERAEKVSDELNRFWNIMIIGVFGSILILVAAFVFLATSLMFIGRFVMLCFLMILSPLAFAAYILPNTHHYYEDWWHRLISNSFFPAAYMILAFVVVKTIQSDAFARYMTNVSFGDAITSGQPDSLGIVINFIILIGLMLGCLTVAQKIGGSTASFGVDMAKKARGLVGGGLALGGGILARKAILGSGRLTSTLPFVRKDKQGKLTLGIKGNAVSWRDLDERFKESKFGNTEFGDFLRNKTTGKLINARIGGHSAEESYLHHKELDRAREAITQRDILFELRKELNQKREARHNASRYEELSKKKDGVMTETEEKEYEGLIDRAERGGLTEEEDKELTAIYTKKDRGDFLSSAEIERMNELDQKQQKGELTEAEQKTLESLEKKRTKEQEEEFQRLEKSVLEQKKAGTYKEKKVLDQEIEKLLPKLQQTMAKLSPTEFVKYMPEDDFHDPEIMQLASPAQIDQFMKKAIEERHLTFEEVKKGLGSRYNYIKEATADIAKRRKQFRRDVQKYIQKNKEIAARNAEKMEEWKKGGEVGSPPEPEPMKDDPPSPPSLWKFHNPIYDKFRRLSGKELEFMHMHDPEMLKSQFLAPALTYGQIDHIKKSEAFQEEEIAEIRLRKDQNVLDRADMSLGIDPTLDEATKEALRNKRRALVHSGVDLLTGLNLEREMNVPDPTTGEMRVTIVKKDKRGEVEKDDKGKPKTRQLTAEDMLTPEEKALVIAGRKAIPDALGGRAPGEVAAGRGAVRYNPMLVKHLNRTFVEKYAGRDTGEVEQQLITPMIEDWSRQFDKDGRIKSKELIISDANLDAFDAILNDTQSPAKILASPLMAERGITGELVKKKLVERREMRKNLKEKAAYTDEQKKFWEEEAKKGTSGSSGGTGGTTGSSAGGAPGTP